MAVIGTNLIRDINYHNGRALADAFNTINDTFTALGVGSSSDADVSFATVAATTTITGATLQTTSGATGTFKTQSGGAEFTAIATAAGTGTMTLTGDSDHSFSLTCTTSSVALNMLSDTTGEVVMNVANNLADALSIKILSGNDFIVFTSTDNVSGAAGELVTIGGTNTGVVTGRVESIPDATTSEAVGVYDSGKVFIQLDADEAVTFQLPATQNGLMYTFVCGHAGGEINISPNASDKITGKGIAGADNQDIKNTNASNAIGDSITIIGDGGDGWWVIAMQGTWATV